MPEAFDQVTGDLVISDRGYERSVTRNLPHGKQFRRTSVHHSSDGSRTNDASFAMHKGKGQNPMMNSVTVSAELGLSLVVPEHGAVPLVASLDYCADDPYAVKMAFHVGTDEPVEWIFARELLADGLAAAAGEGDVQVWPDESDEGDILNITLSSPFGEAHFEAPLSATAEFLRSTYGIIPAGSESGHIDLDSELDDLLWQA
jgi:Streptomyces sporulation and cell division protein, SsgA